MKPITDYTDRFAIGLSSLCVLHCLASPLLVLLLPILTAIQFDDEVFHSWLLAAVLPTSLLSLILGCRKHQNHKVLMLGITGLAILFLALFLEDYEVGELLEKAATVLGALVVASSHYLNYSLCRRDRDCNCHPSG